MPLNKTNINNSKGLSISFLESGSIKDIKVDSIRISLQTATLFSKLGANLYLRKRANKIEYKPLLGAESNSLFKVTESAFIAKGVWDRIEYECMLQLSDQSLSWQWSINIKNTTNDKVELDVVYVQDTALKPTADGLNNEYYVSQYLERLILEDGNYASVICCRQNAAVEEKNPWLMMACENSAIAASVDGMQLYGRA